jgi:hypothetical protein
MLSFVWAAKGAIMEGVEREGGAYVSVVAQTN